MNTDSLLIEVESVFPMVDKPRGLDLSFHKDECPQCEYLRQDLEMYEERELPTEALRELYQEMSCLSAEGWRWALPSYLKHSLMVPLSEARTFNDRETEFLIYNLGPAEEHQADTLQRLAALNQPQIDCLIHLLEWCTKHEHWSDYCAADIERALSFMHKVRSNRG